MGCLIYRGYWLAFSLAFFLSSDHFVLAAQKPATPKPLKVDSNKLHGVLNFRDIGGYKTADGHIIRYNLLYRSAVLAAMTPADNAELAPLRIRYEIDLRTPAQRAQLPTNWGANPPKQIDIPFIPGNLPPLKIQDIHNPVKVKEIERRGYTTYAILNAATMGQVLHLLAQGDVPALVHCNGGRDRTGVTVAVLMTLLGASRQEVYHEYLLSNRPATAEQQQQMATVRHQPDSPSAADGEPKKEDPLDTTGLDAFFHAIDAKYGSFHAYVRDGLKLSDKDVQDLRRRFLTD
jgi:protein-tyrosine phosphatase